MAPTHKRPKFVDVAKLAGAGVATASRTLSGTSCAAPGTRWPVPIAIRNPHYPPSRRACGPRRRSSHNVGLIVPDLLSAYCIPPGRCGKPELRPAGYHRYLAITRDDVALERDTFLDIIGQAVDGLIC